jgi:hypothetical protein
MIWTPDKWYSAHQPPSGRSRREHLSHCSHGMIRVVIRVGQLARKVHLPRSIRFSERPLPSQFGRLVEDFWFDCIAETHHCHLCPAFSLSIASPQKTWFPELNEYQWIMPKVGDSVLKKKVVFVMNFAYLVL